MPKVKNHIIKTLCFDVQVADEPAAVAFADKLRNIDCELILNNVFKKYDYIKDTIRLDRVELDIGSIELEQMDNIGGEIFHQLEDTFDRVLKSKINRIPLTAKEKLDTEEISLHKVSTIETDIEALIHYLKTGSLSWNIVDTPDMEELLLKILQADASKLRMAIVPELGSSIVLKRISTVFRHSTIVVLLKSLMDEDRFRQIEYFSALIMEHISSSQVRNFENELAAISLSCVNSSVHQKQNFSSVFFGLMQPLLNIFTVLTLETIHGHIQEIIQSIPDDQQKYFYRSVDEIVVQLIKTKEISDEESNEPNLNSVLNLKDEAESFKSGKKDIIQKYEAESVKSGKKDIMLKDEEESVKSGKHDIIVKDKTELTKSGKQDSILKDETEPVKEGNQESIPEDEKMKNREDPLDTNEEQQYYYIDNAGLVLLNWVLIQNSFEQLGWVKERKIVDEQSKQKILIWMDYLIWGQRRIHEYGLILNKVLIGIHPSDVADIHESITRKEKKAADELLKTVIEYWSVLKSTSFEGFRTAFLQRNGKLSNEDGGWQMHVESKGYDILIDSLPWTYTIIKSPWMEKPLFIQWSTKV